jgi:hypothetical protein
MSEEEGRMHSLCLQLPSVSRSFFGGEKCPKSRASLLQREYSVANAHFKKKEKSPNCDRKLVFAAEGVRRLMPTGYTFMTFVEKSRQ